MLFYVGGYLRGTIGATQSGCSFELPTTEAENEVELGTRMQAL